MLAEVKWVSGGDRFYALFLQVWDHVVDNTAVFLESDHHVEIYPRMDEVPRRGHS